jgi:mannobiose 2-epimerase
MTRRKFVSPPALAAAQSDPDIPRTRAELQETLMKNILGFWNPRVLHRERGGYAMDFDAKGVPIPGRPKLIVTQARMVWFFARMARAGYGDRQAMLEAAGHGYRFLTAKMRDAVHGGFHWEVNAQATEKTRPDKRLYGNSFGLYALSEYALASGRKIELLQKSRAG